MSDEQREQPFKNLGEKLKTIRQKLHESVAEVSGAVEIDEQSLQRIEQGSERPSEDILLLLINHFGMQDDDAAILWQLAGYDEPHDHDDRGSSQSDNQNRTMVMIMAVDPRVIYSDGVQVTANANGVIFGFSQGIGTPQAMTTAKIGMSREQAYAMLRVLQQTLEASKPRQLPSSSEKKDDQAK
ncbi:MAG TPA: helix-turn-helix transcriptional regulator [Candidatus Pristimantibacillus sp.]|nr:helix-turn-helix transcriptional regulator [Candidatus Pristimantibacillus sp.]